MVLKIVIFCGPPYQNDHCPWNGRKCSPLNKKRLSATFWIRHIVRAGKCHRTFGDFASKIRHCLDLSGFLRFFSCFSGFWFKLRLHHMLRNFGFFFFFFNATFPQTVWSGNKSLLFWASVFWLIAWQLSSTSQGAVKCLRMFHSFIHLFVHFLSSRHTPGATLVVEGVLEITSPSPTALRLERVLVTRCDSRAAPSRPCPAGFPELCFPQVALPALEDVNFLSLCPFL